MMSFNIGSSGVPPAGRRPHSSVGARMGGVGTRAFTETREQPRPMTQILNDV